jgi:chromate transporter
VLLFVKASAFIFGSRLVIVPFLRQELVHDHDWLSELRFAPAVAVGSSSARPAVIKATFAGNLVDGGTGAVIATAAVFLPMDLFVTIRDPLLGRHGEQPRPAGFLKRATAGAIAGAAIAIGEQVMG